MASIEADLFRQIQARDQQAMGMLYDHLAPLVHAVLRRILDDQSDVDEVLGETFWQVWERAASYDPERGTVEGWILTMARSRALDCLRSRQRRATHTASYAAQADADPPPPTSLPETAALHEERAQAVATALAALPSEERRPIEMAYYEGLRQTDIATRLGQPVGTVKTRIRRGLTQLRKVLAPYAGDNP